jgi:hypothetical protein
MQWISPKTGRKSTPLVLFNMHLLTAAQAVSTECMHLMHAAMQEVWKVHRLRKGILLHKYDVHCSSLGKDQMKKKVKI